MRYLVAAMLLTFPAHAQHYIVLDKAQAEEVRGPSDVVPWRALDPIAVDDGSFVLGEEVLEDKAHEKHRDMLAKLPVVKDVKFKASEE